MKTMTQYPQAISKKWIKLSEDTYVDLSGEATAQAAKTPWKRAVRCQSSGDIVYVISKRFAVGAPERTVRNPDGSTKSYGWQFHRPEIFIKNQAQAQRAAADQEAESLYSTTMAALNQAEAEVSAGAR